MLILLCTSFFVCITDSSVTSSAVQMLSKLIVSVFIIIGLAKARLDLTPFDPDTEETEPLQDDPGNDQPFQCNSSSTEATFHADPKDCHSYYICLNGTASHQTCPRDMAYHCEMNLCVSDIYTPGCRPPVLCKSDGFIADSKDCTKFFQCSYGHPYHMKCADGTKFDPASSICSPDVPCLTKKTKTSKKPTNL